uniref:Uncharacterized protein n=1 Tax=Anguilla anguilla TaxID=7936 RepID=A0A0E9VS48_ANGAN
MFSSKYCPLIRQNAQLSELIGSRISSAFQVLVQLRMLHHWPHVVKLFSNSFIK